MKKILTATAILCLTATFNSASAQTREYDYRTGNSYNVRPNAYGGATVDGFNSRTGSNWNTRIQRDGRMSGRDSNGNFWNYNPNTGFYSNSNGKTCYGKGATRVCN